MDGKRTPSRNLSSVTCECSVTLRTEGEYKICRRLKGKFENRSILENKNIKRIKFYNFLHIATVLMSKTVSCY